MEETSFVMVTYTPREVVKYGHKSAVEDKYRRTSKFTLHSLVFLIPAHT
jgi:hypothetical protein